MLGRKLPARWERASFSSLSRCGKRIPVCLLNTGRAPFCEAERLGFFPLAVKLYSHRITTCLRFLKPFVQMSNSYCAGSKFRPWLSRPWNPFKPAPGSEAPRTHTKEGIKKKHSHTQKNYSLVISYSVPITALNSLNATSHLILIRSPACQLL